MMNGIDVAVKREIPSGELSERTEKETASLAPTPGLTWGWQGFVPRVIGACKIIWHYRTSKTIPHCALEIL